MTSPDRARFDAIRRRYMAAVDRERAYRMDVLYERYRDRAPSRSWMTNSEITRLERFRAAQDREGEKMFALLERISPRDWRSGVPYVWVMESLSFEDAVTDGALSTVPDVAYGQTEADVRRFAASLS